MRVLKHYLNSSGAKSLLRFKPNPHTSGVAGFFAPHHVQCDDRSPFGRAWRDNTQDQRTVALRLEQLMKHSHASRDVRNHIALIPDDAMSP